MIYAFGMVPLARAEPVIRDHRFLALVGGAPVGGMGFELFTAAVTGYFLMALGLVSRKLVERAVLFEWILILISGILGTGHHMYWVGEPGLWIGVGSMFSFLEVLPLVLLVLEAIEQQRNIGKQRTSRIAWPICTWSVRRSGISSAPGCSVVARSMRRW